MNLLEDALILVFDFLDLSLQGFKLLLEVLCFGGAFGRGVVVLLCGGAKMGAGRGGGCCHLNTVEWKSE